MTFGNLLFRVSGPEVDSRQARRPRIMGRFAGSDRSAPNGKICTTSDTGVFAGVATSTAFPWSRTQPYSALISNRRW